MEATTMTVTLMALLNLLIFGGPFVFSYLVGLQEPEEPSQEFFYLPVYPLVEFSVVIPPSDPVDLNFYAEFDKRGRRTHDWLKEGF